MSKFTLKFERAGGEEPALILWIDLVARRLGAKQPRSELQQRVPAANGNVAAGRCVRMN